jgi:methyl-accepting chemotaxis protein
MRRLLGIVMLVIGLAGVVLSIAGANAGRRLIGDMGTTLDSNLQLTVQSLETVNSTLVLTKATVRQLSQSLDTMETTASNVGTSLSDTQPMLEQIAEITSSDLAEGLETFEASLPDLIEVADTIDQTLTTLSRFRIDRTILGIPLRYDLGINYDPEVPFSQSVEEIGASIEGLPEQLRELEIYFEVANDNLGAISENMTEIAGDLAVVNDSVDDLEPLLDEFMVAITEFSDSTRQMRATFRQQLETFQTVWTVVMVWLALTQVAPLYLGYELVTGRRVS